MLYITGIHALNLPCSLDTCGDWHTSAISWDNPDIRDTQKSFFGEYGVEKAAKSPLLDKIYKPPSPQKYNIANHIRALLDLLEIGHFSVAQGMNKDFICNDSYNSEIFNKVSEMKALPNFPAIDNFMSKEYLMKWVNYKKEHAL
jgi:hypothetical protein